jgi:hypothetical protein
MKINQIIQETTTSGSVAPVAHGFVKMQTRSPSVYGDTKAGNLLKGKKTNKPYGNSLNEGAMNQLSLDLKGGADGLSDVEFQKKYKMTKQEARKELSTNRKENKKPQPVSEAELSEDDVILIPGQGRKMKTGFVPHGQSRVDHEVEMARSDLLSAAKNAEAIFNMIESTSEDEGLQGWVQEKIIKANDYLNSVREYLEGKEYQSVAEGVRDLGYDAQSLIMKLRRDVEEKRLQPTPQAVLAAARELAGDMEIAPQLLVKQVLGQSVAEGSKKKTPGVALSKGYKKDFDGKKPEHTKPETALTGTYSKTGKPGGELKKQGVGEGRATYGPVTDAHKAASKKVFSAGVRDGKAGAEKNKQHMSSALMKTTYLNGYKQGASEGKSK